MNEWLAIFDQVMKELLDSTTVQLFVRLDNRHLFTILTIIASNKRFIIDNGNHVPAGSARRDGAAQ